MLLLVKNESKEMWSNYSMVTSSRCLLVIRHVACAAALQHSSSVAPGLAQPGQVDTL